MDATVTPPSLNRIKAESLIRMWKVDGPFQTLDFNPPLDLPGFEYPLISLCRHSAELDSKIYYCFDTDYGEVELAMDSTRMSPDNLQKILNALQAFDVL